MKLKLPPTCLLALAWLTAELPAATLYVDLNCPTPTPPYTSWATAATNIQTAIDAASAGDTVLVTNGVYATGGKSVDGIITNRIAINKVITVQGVNGAMATFIEGNWNPTVTNGPLAVRCVWLTNQATLDGFTLRGGGTRDRFSSANAGGGVLGASNNAVVLNCVIVSNSASFQGGGAYNVALSNCYVGENHAVGNGSSVINVVGAGSGGGAAYCQLSNCIVAGNFADGESGGGAFVCTLRNCAVTGNTALVLGGGVCQCKLVNCTLSSNVKLYTPPVDSSPSGGAATSSLTNCIASGNTVNYLGITIIRVANYYNCTLAYCASTPLATGTGNIDVDPQLLSDGYHLLLTSPCRGVGSSSFAGGTDMDGESWASPPSMGCDEPVAAGLVGSIGAYFSPASTNVYVNHAYSFTGQTTGRVATVSWDFGDGSTATNTGLTVTHTWTNSGLANLTLTVYNGDYPAGVSGALAVNVLPLGQPQMQTTGMYSNRLVFTFEAQSNLTYQIQKANNLVVPISWTTMTSRTTNSNVTITITNVPLTNASAYYRLQVQ